MSEEISFGIWLRKQRRALDLSRNTFANQVGCAEVTLRRIEAGTLKPSKELASILLEKIGISETERPQWISFARGLSGFPFKPFLSSTKPKSNLPAPITTFIGRKKEQLDVIQLINRHRLITLTGPGGVGKTRLSIRVGEQVLQNYPDGVWLVELAPILDALLVPRTTAIAVGLRDEPQRPVIDMLCHYLQEKSMLIILDNCEHLLEACAQLSDTLLRGCPNLKILATSREMLGILGEAVYQVPSLELPDIQQLLEKFRDYESVQLFEERAQLARMDFSLTIENAASVTRICSQLDGIPLAIELAAARVSTFSSEQIADRLSESFSLLTIGNRTALPRHQTLRATIDWSYNLLSPAEETLFRRLSVFAGNWTLEEAESVCAGDDIERHKILDILTQLVNKSLILAKPEPGQKARYQMLETLRQYGHEKLWVAGEKELICQQHLICFVDLAERAEPNLRAFDMIMWLDRLEIELDNIRVALEYALENDIEAELRLASALLWLWWIRGHQNEGIDWLERGLSIESIERGDSPSQFNRAMSRGKALNASGLLNNWAFETSKAEGRLEESLALFRGLGPAGQRGLAYALRVLGSGADLQGDSGRAKSLLEESRVLFHKLGDKFGIAECLMDLGGFALSQGDFSRARALWEERLALSEEIGDKDGIAMSLAQLGQLAAQQGDRGRAISLTKGSLVVAHELGQKNSIAYLLEHLAYFARGQSQQQRAVCLLGAAQVLRENMNSPVGAGSVLADEEAEYNHTVATARVALSEEGFAKVWAEGQTMTLEEAVAYALKED